MFTNDRLLKFQGFHPSEYTRLFLDEKMNLIHEEAPYGATLSAVFTRKGRIFKGVVTIYSSVGKFVAVSQGTKLNVTANKLISQIRKQLEKWKSSRFEAEQPPRPNTLNNNGSTFGVSDESSSVA